ncbi:hypothetical protein ACIRRH_09765 [Kitasatospora sp. NPDC101235]|uniref:hypothetical protein n=1 Tax=Kitasatospora sp. NPDC101235 TaxID=3364101 RepID=UPI00382D6BB5
MAVITTGRYGFALLGVVQAVLIFTIAILTVPLPLVAREFTLGPSGVLLLSAAYALTAVVVAALPRTATPTAPERTIRIKEFT